MAVFSKTIALLRGILFNIVFYGGTLFFCLIYIPALLLPRHLFLYCLELYFNFVYVTEKYILGLDFRVIGAENLPKDGAYLVASKHQSAYETMKIHLLFKDPAVIYKKELGKIPFWGWMIRKGRMIAIDRSAGKSAIQTIIDNAKPVIEAGRPIIIYPQGTRVAVGVDKPYKYGFMKLYETYDIPIIPVALNSGVYWKRNAWVKKPGIVTFEILPAIPTGQDPKQSFETVKNLLEEHSDRLCQQAMKSK